MSTTITPMPQGIDINVVNDIINVDTTTSEINIEVAGAYPLPSSVYSVFGRVGDVVAVDGDYVLNQLGDTSITSPTISQVLKYNGTNWVNASETGTVSSVAVTRSGDALAITGSPITTSGTINIGFAGTGAQYIKGDGTLATFPTTIAQSERLITEVYNSTGATLTKGTVVYINGGQGNLPTITKAIATGDATSAQTFGIVQSDITNNNNGYVVISGKLTDLDTQAYAAGTQLYLSSTTAGAYTSTKQYAPAHLVYVGIIVRSHPTQGVIEVKIQNGYELDELHDVSAQSPSNGDILQYVSSTGLWTKKTGSTTNIAEGTNLYYTEARVNANTNVAANTAARHNAVTLGTANGLSLSTQVLSLGLAGTSSTGALSSTDWNTFNSKQNAITNPVTGTGTTNYLTKWSSVSGEIINSNLFDSGTTIYNNNPSDGQYAWQFNASTTSGQSYGVNILAGTTSADIALRILNAAGSSEYVRVTGNGNLFLGTTTGAANLVTAKSITAATAIARGVYFNNTLVAAANNDVLVGLDIAPTFTNGAFTGVSNYGIRMNSGSGIAFTSTNTQVIKARSQGLQFDFSGGVTGYWNSDGQIQPVSISTGGFVAGVSNGIATLTAVSNSILRLNAGSTSNAARLELQQAAATKWYVGINTNSDFSISTDGGMANGLGVFLATKNVVIGSGTDAGYKLDVNGTTRLNGNATLAGTSNSSSGLFSINGTGGNNQQLSLAAVTFGVGSNSQSIRIQTPTINPSSGSFYYAGLDINGSIISATSTYSGSISGIRNAPASISVASGTYYGIYSTALTAQTNVWNLYMDGTANNYIGGDIAIGTTTLGTATKLTVGGSETASSAIARGGLINTTLTAAANNDVLVGLDINPTFTNGAFTSVRNYAARFNGNISVGTKGQFTTYTLSNQIYLGNSNITASNQGTGGDLILIANGYYNGTNVVTRESGYSTLINLNPNNDGRTLFQTSANLAAGATITYATSGTIFQTGNWLLGTGTTDAGYKLDVNGTARVQGAITAQANGHTFGNFQILTSGNAGTTGQGITVTGADATVQFQGSGSISEMFVFRNWGGTATLRTLNNSDSAVARFYGGYQDGNINNLSGNQLWLSPTYNFAGTRTGIVVRGIYYAPTLTSLTNTTHRAIETATGDVLLGTTSGSVGIGANTSINASAILDITSTSKGVLFPRMSTTQKTAISTPATGLVVYDTTLNKLSVYTGSAWETVTSL